MFFNIEAVPHSTCLPWEHSANQNGEPCSNPRYHPQKPDSEHRKEKVSVDVRSFESECPCIGQESELRHNGLNADTPPALAWVWRLVAPRATITPVFSDVRAHSEVGSYWSFATGLRVNQANML